MTIADIKRESLAIRKRMMRCSDKKSLMKLKPRIAQLEADLKLLRERVRPRFRKSYGYESFLEQLALGRKKSRA